MWGSHRIAPTRTPVAAMLCGVAGTVLQLVLCVLYLPCQEVAVSPVILSLTETVTDL